MIGPRGEQSSWKVLKWGKRIFPALDRHQILPAIAKIYDGSTACAFDCEQTVFQSKVSELCHRFSDNCIHWKMTCAADGLLHDKSNVKRCR
jgi:hypothetical protein